MSSAGSGSAASRSARETAARQVFGEGVDASPRLHRSIDGGHVLLHEYRAQLAEITAEAIAERLALRLTVIREHHDVVPPGGVLSERLQCRKDPVQPVKGGDRLGAEHAGMVGDLVVVNVVDVDALGSLTHFLRDHCSVEVALHDVGSGATDSLPPLLYQLRSRPYHSPGEPLRIGQEPGERMPCRSGVTGLSEVAHCQDGAGCIPGEQIAEG